MLPDGRLRTEALSGLAENSVGASQLVALSVTGDKIAENTIVAEKLADGSVTETKIADGAVTEDKFGNESIPATAYKSNTIPLDALAGFITREYISADASDDSARAIVADAIANEAIVDRTVKDVAVGKLTGGSDYDMLLRVAGVWSPIAIAGALTYNVISGEFELDSGVKAATFGDTKARGSVGGTAIAASWNTREIGEITDPANITTIIGLSCSKAPT